jgi:hypothetical protein
LKPKNTGRGDRGRWVTSTAGSRPDGGGGVEGFRLIADAARCVDALERPAELAGCEDDRAGGQASSRAARVMPTVPLPAWVWRSVFIAEWLSVKDL